MIGLLTVVFGTISANCLNLYSGAMSALTAWDSQRRTPVAIGYGALFAAMTAGLLVLARGAEADGALITVPIIIGTSAAVGILTMLVVRFTLLRWQAALGIGILGGALALVGTHPERTAHLYSDFLLSLSLWAAPWAGAVLGSRGTILDARFAPGGAGWLAGLFAAVLLSQQEWFTGPLAARIPGGGDWSYFAGFAVAFAVTWIVSRGTGSTAALAHEVA
jgi:purine-cytosine permease-like protein